MSSSPAQAPWPATAALVAVAVLWGLTFTLTKIGLAELGPEAFVAARFGLAGLVGAGGLAWAAARDGRLPPGAASGLLLGALNLAVQGMQARSLVSLSAARAALLAGSHLLFVPTLQAVAGLGRPRRLEVVASGICLVGLALVAGDRPGPMGAGEAWAVGAEVAFAAYLLVTARLRPTPGGALALTGWQLAATGLGAAVLAGPALPTLADVGPSCLAAAVAAALACTLLPTWLQLRFQPALAPSHAALLLSLEPPLAAVAGIALLGERLGAEAWAGAALMVAAAALPSWARRGPGRA